MTHQSIRLDDDSPWIGLEAHCFPLLQSDARLEAPVSCHYPCVFSADHGEVLHGLLRLGNHGIIFRVAFGRALRQDAFVELGGLAKLILTGRDRRTPQLHERALQGDLSNR